MTDYLPKNATIEQACDWLQDKTGQTWILPRLLECYLTPYFWIDYSPGKPAIFGDRIEGFQSRMLFHGDICRLESDGADALVNMFAAHDGSLIRAEPGWRVPLSELRFKRDEIEATAEIINKQKAAPAQAAKPAPETVEQRCARFLAWFTEEQRINPRGALQRVTEREAKQNPKADRSNISKDIKKARGTAKTQKQAGAMFGQLVQVKDGKRQH